MIFTCDHCGQPLTTVLVESRLEEESLFHWAHLRPVGEAPRFTCADAEAVATWHGSEVVPDFHPDTERDDGDRSQRWPYESVVIW